MSFPNQSRSFSLHDRKRLCMHGRVPILPARGVDLELGDPPRIGPLHLQLRVPGEFEVEDGTVLHQGSAVGSVLDHVAVGVSRDRGRGWFRPAVVVSSRLGQVGDDVADDVLGRVVFFQDPADGGGPGVAGEDGGRGAGQGAVVYRYLAGEDGGGEALGVACVVVEGLDQMLLVYARRFGSDDQIKGLPVCGLCRGCLPCRAGTG